MNVLITGGAGFIGAAVVQAMLAQPYSQVANIDKLTYAAVPDRLETVRGEPRYAFLEAGIADREALRAAFSTYRPNVILHLAAETHVDRSIDKPDPFVQTNILGTFALLEEALGYWSALADQARDRLRFVHVSTDEVFGPAASAEVLSVDSPYRPSSPYAATKAAADHLVQAWCQTYGFPALIVHCTNTFGPYQYPEKLIPLVIIRALRGERLPLYGQGDQERDWLYVDDCAAGMLAILERGEVGKRYVLGGGETRRNIDVVRSVCRILDGLIPRSESEPYENLIEFVTDRPGHDARYALDPEPTQQALGWQPQTSFDIGLQSTVRCYVENRGWWESILSSEYGGERLGLARQRQTAHATGGMTRTRNVTS